MRIWRRSWPWSFFARDAKNLLAFVASEKVPPLALRRVEYFSQDADAMFGGLFDQAPGFPELATLEQRKAGRKASPG